MDLLELSTQYGFRAGVALFLSGALTYLAIRIFPKLGLMDRPRRYGLKRKPIPYYGGIAIFLAFLISVLLFVPLNSHVIGLLIGSGLIFVTGFFDDLLNLSPILRLVIQFVAAAVLVIFGVGILSFNLPFFGTIALDYPVVSGFALLSAVFTIIWVMTIVNVMNFLDGVSGLNSGVTFIAGLTLFLLSIHPQIHEDPTSQIPVATIALIVSMVALGFLVFDFPKPKILMGDSGSTLFGFLLATLAIFSGGKVATAFLVLGIPILDMVWVVLRRTLSGRKFWQGDLKHLHHRLLELNFSPQTVVLMYLAVSMVFGTAAVSLVSSQQKLFMLTSLVVLMLLLAAAIIFLPKKGDS